MSAEGLWAITSYFNPAGYANRLHNYATFRDRLDVPLLTVELAWGEAPALGKEDADRLIQLAGGSVLWQKERLLNLALAALPPGCRYVAWIDCDLVFEEADWHLGVREALQRVRLVQPYEYVLDVDPGADPEHLATAPVLLERESMASKHCRGARVDGVVQSNMLKQYSPGHAWAARRDVLDQTGFYEGMILGSGDFVMATAAMGRHREIPRAYLMNDRQAAHYLTWARRFHEGVEGDLGVVPGRLFHLWHGDLADRGYDVRYEGLAGHRFDPHTDVAVADGGPLRWSSEKPDLHEYAKSYFASRREDG